MDQLGKLCKNTTTKLDHGISHEDEKSEDLPLSKTLKAQRFYRRRNHVFNSLASRRASRHSRMHFFSTFQLPKVIRTWCAFRILVPSRLQATGASTFLCLTFRRPNALRATVVRTFAHTSTFRSAPTLRCFWHCGLDMRLRTTAAFNF